jgi:light-regulated signal transduction histidine kinase (bacteriophytochrome)
LNASEPDLRGENARLGADLAALNAELDAFSYSVSHDLRAPVRAVFGYARSLDEEYGNRLDDEGRRLLAVVSSEAERMGQLIDGLLTISRLGRHPMAVAPVDMTSLAREAAVEQLQAAGLPASVVDIGDLPGIGGDRILLREVWVQLLANAFKFSSRAEEPQVHVSAVLETERIVYHVRDHGVGFDMKYAGKLFGVFQRLHRSSEFPGAGVGLAIVSRIVHRHAGTVWADARLNGGATFSFGLPIGVDA